MHAETVAADPSTIRWVLPGEHLPCGHLLAAPGPLGGLLTSGTLDEVTTEPHGVTMRLAPDRNWRAEGDAVREALSAALGDIARWVVEIDEDGTLRRIADDVLAGPVGNDVRGHGGVVTVVGACDGVLEVAFEGACSGCPAAGVTLHSRLETAVRERYPDLREVRDVATCRAPRTLVLRLKRRPHESPGSVDLR